MPHDSSADAESVLLNEIPAPKAEWTLDAETAARWEKLLALRSDVNKELERVRADKTVTKAQDATVTITLNDEAQAAFDESMAVQDLKTLFNVSKVTILKGEGDGMPGESFPGVTVKAEPNTAPKCPRCWNHDESIGIPGGHAELCPRCAKAIAVQLQ